MKILRKVSEIFRAKPVDILTYTKFLEEEVREVLDKIYYNGEKIKYSIDLEKEFRNDEIIKIIFILQVNGKISFQDINRYEIDLHPTRQRYLAEKQSAKLIKEVLPMNIITLGF